MHIYEALQVEGTSSYELLFYAVFSPDCHASTVWESKSIPAGDDTAVYQLGDKTWPWSIVLIDIFVSEPRSIPCRVIEILHQVIERNACIAVVCMLDGAFGGYEDIFSEDCAKDTYGFCTEPGAATVCLGYDVRSSKSWRDIIVEQGKRLS